MSNTEVLLNAFDIKEQPNDENNIISEAKFWVTLNDGKTSYPISEEDYKSIKEIINHPGNNKPATFDLGQKKHEKQANVWEIRTIIIANVLSLNRHEPEAIQEPKNRKILIIPKKDVNFNNKFLEYVLKVSEKDYKWFKENLLKISQIGAGSHGIPAHLIMENMISIYWIILINRYFLSLPEKSEGLSLDFLLNSGYNKNMNKLDKAIDYILEKKEFDSLSIPQLQSKINLLKQDIERDLGYIECYKQTMQPGDWLGGMAETIKSLEEKRAKLNRLEKYL